MKAKVLWLLVFIFIVIFACSVSQLGSRHCSNLHDNGGTSPTGVAYDSAKGEIFVANTAVQHCLSYI